MVTFSGPLDVLYQHWESLRVDGNLPGRKAFKVGPISDIVTNLLVILVSRTRGVTLQFVHPNAIDLARENLVGKNMLGSVDSASRGRISGNTFLAAAQPCGLFSRLPMQLEVGVVWIEITMLPLFGARKDQTMFVGAYLPIEPAEKEKIAFAFGVYRQSAPVFFDIGFGVPQEIE